MDAVLKKLKRERPHDRSDCIDLVSFVERDLVSLAPDPN